MVIDRGGVDLPHGAPFRSDGTLRDSIAAVCARLADRTHPPANGQPDDTVDTACAAHQPANPTFQPYRSHMASTSRHRSPPGLSGAVRHHRLSGNLTCPNHRDPALWAGANHTEHRRNIEMAHKS